MSNPKINLKRFGEKLRVLRSRRALSLRQLSNELGVSYSYIAKMERGEKIPSVAMALTVAYFFDVTTDVLLKDELELED